MSNLFSCDYHTIRRNVTGEERNQDKNDGFWLLWEIFNEYIKQNIVMQGRIQGMSSQSDGLTYFSHKICN